MPIRPGETVPTVESFCGGVVGSRRVVSPTAVNPASSPWDRQCFRDRDGEGDLIHLVPHLPVRLIRAKFIYRGGIGEERRCGRFEVVGGGQQLLQVLSRESPDGNRPLVPGWSSWHRRTWSGPNEWDRVALSGRVSGFHLPSHEARPVERSLTAPRRGRVKLANASRSTRAR